MRQFSTVVLERMRSASAGFATEPYETGWASEASFFIRVHSISGSGTRLEAKVQTSVDGIEWVDEGTRFPPIDRSGNSFVRVRHFGGWLRLVNTLSGDDPQIEVTIHLVLKE